MASCILFLGTYYGLRNGKFLELISKPTTMTLLIICLNYENIMFFFSLNGCSSGFLTVILLLREDVIILDCTALCRFLLPYLCTRYMKYSVFQCCIFSVQFSPHAIPGKRNVVDFIPTNDVVFLTFLVVEVHVVDLIFQ